MTRDPTGADRAEMDGFVYAFVLHCCWESGYMQARVQTPSKSALGIEMQTVKANQIESRETQGTL
jgi:hypothetical protein